VDRSIVDVARMAGVTARTLRHYDHIGLLPPSSIGTDGYRRYDETALLRLQHILVLRALGLPLQEIGAVLAAERDEIATLREHRDRLLAEGRRLGRMAETVERTLEELVAQEGNDTMTVERPENLFEGFDPSEYEAEARERWPEQAASSAAFTADLTPADTERMQQEFTAHLTRIGGLAAAGLPVADAAVQEEIDWLHGSVSRMWTPDAAAFTNLGRMYVDDERFRSNYDRVAPGLAEFVRDAMAEYARTRLA
jgi:DNA-binding transcriptional MerR regulator